MKKDTNLHIGVAVVIFRDDHVLLGKRIHAGMGGGMFQFPGGHAEPNESFEHTADREVFEETGLETHGHELICYQDTYFEKIDKWYRTFFYAAFLDYSDAVPANNEPEKCEGWGWYPLDALPSPMFEIEDATLYQIRQKARKLKAANAL